MIVPSALLTWASVTSRGPRAEEPVEVVEVEPSVIGDRHVGERRAGRRGQLLPRDEVGVVLHLGRDDEVAGPTLARPQL